MKKKLSLKKPLRELRPELSFTVSVARKALADKQKPKIEIPRKSDIVSTDDVKDLSRALLKQLDKKYPAFKKRLPLVVNIHQSTVLRKYNKGVLKEALRYHTSRVAYLENLIEGDKRFNIRCEPKQDILTQHKENATKKLAKIKLRIEAHKAKLKKQKEKAL